MNEEDSWTDNRDELYVRAQAVAPNGATPLSVTSNTVVANFCHLPVHPRPISSPCPGRG